MESESVCLFLEFTINDPTSKALISHVVGRRDTHLAKRGLPFGSESVIFTHGSIE